MRVGDKVRLLDDLIDRQWGVIWNAGDTLEVVATEDMDPSIVAVKHDKEPNRLIWRYVYRRQLELIDGTATSA